jgi:hypothetical protein
MSDPTPRGEVPGGGRAPAMRAFVGRRPVVTATLVLSIPLVVLAVSLLRRNWHPVLDLAMTEFRVRDVGGANTPLIGLPGRIGRFPDQGSHPGPLSFYLLAPIYRLLGSSAWGLLVGAIVVNIAAVATALWIMGRRTGAWGVWVGAAVLALVLRGYGTEVLEQPWNPYLPVLVWVVLLLGVWSVLLGDHALLPVVVAAGTLCTQTHIPYLPLTVGMVALVVGALLWQWRRDVPLRPAIRRNAIRSGVLGLVLWVPVLVDQLVREPGNLRMLIDHFSSPPGDEPVVGVGEGVRLVLRHLDIVRLARYALDGDEYFVRAGYRLDGPVLVGAVVLVVWASSVIVAMRRRNRSLMALHAVVGWSLLLAAISLSRVFGKVWYYLTLWCWATTVLLVVAVVATCAVELVARWPHWRPRLAVPAAALALLGGLSLTAFVVDAARAEVPEEHLSDTLALLVEPTATAIESGLGSADGSDGRYTVTYADAAHFGSQAYGLVSELERLGFDVGMPETWRVPVTPHRVIREQEATAQLRLATGAYIAVVAALPGAEQAVLVDPRSAAERERQDRLRTEVTRALDDAGLDDLVSLLDENLFGLQLDPRVSPEIQAMVDEMIRIGLPTAVFVLPPETSA